MPNPARDKPLDGVAEALAARSDIRLAYAFGSAAEGGEAISTWPCSPTGRWMRLDARN